MGTRSTLPATAGIRPSLRAARDAHYNAVLSLLEDLHATARTPIRSRELAQAYYAHTLPTGLVHVGPRALRKYLKNLTHRGLVRAEHKSFGALGATAFYTPGSATA